MSEVLCTAVRTALHSAPGPTSGLWSSFDTRITHFALAGLGVALGPFPVRDRIGGSGAPPAERSYLPFQSSTDESTEGRCRESGEQASRPADARCNRYVRRRDESRLPETRYIPAPSGTGAPLRPEDRPDSNEGLHGAGNRKCPGHPHCLETAGSIRRALYAATGATSTSRKAAFTTSSRRLSAGPLGCGSTGWVSGRSWRATRELSGLGGVADILDGLVPAAVLRRD